LKEQAYLHVKEKVDNIRIKIIFFVFGIFLLVEDIIIVLLRRSFLFLKIYIIKNILNLKNKKLVVKRLIGEN